MIAATIGGPNIMDSKIPLTISLMKSHIVCYKVQSKRNLSTDNQIYQEMESIIHKSSNLL